MTPRTLRTISLNTWGDCTGQIVPDVMRLQHSAHVLCFQEVYRSPVDVPEKLWPRIPGKRTGHINSKLFIHLSEALDREFVGYFVPQMRGFMHDIEPCDYPDLEYGNAMFVRRGLLHSYRDGFIYGHLNKTFDDPHGTPVGKTGQVVEIHDETGPITVAHAHGAWYKSDKTTNFPWRDAQAEGILRLMSPHYDVLDTLAANDDYQPRAVLVGDLNVVTASRTIKKIATSKVFSRVGGWHLNPRSGVWSTRTKLYTGEIREANHAFASHALNPRLTIDDTVQSDHAALIVDAEL